MSKRKASSIDTYKVRYRYVGPKGDVRYQARYLLAGSQEDAGVVMAKIAKERKFRGCVVTSVELVPEGDQLELIDLVD